jgi:Bacterial antitoxin of type II TA system, VapB
MTMRTNIVLDQKLVAKAMKKSGAKSMREAVHAALCEYVSEPDYEGLLALRGSNLIDPDYDPKAGYPSPEIIGEPRQPYRQRKARRPVAKPR